MTEHPLPPAGQRERVGADTPRSRRRPSRVERGSPLETVTGRKGVLAATALPSPPTSEEKYSYLGRQHRWLLFVQTTALGLVVFTKRPIESVNPCASSSTS